MATGRERTGVTVRRLLLHEPVQEGVRTPTVTAGRGLRVTVTGTSLEIDWTWVGNDEDSQPDLGSLHDKDMMAKEQGLGFREVTEFSLSLSLST